MPQLLKNWTRVFIDPLLSLGIARLPQYFIDWKRYNKLAQSKSANWEESYPCLNDKSTYTPFDPHYFYQACWAARKLSKNTSTWHVDVGSSVMMVGVISAYVPTVFVDCRPLMATMANLLTLAGDLSALPFGDCSIPSLSCLHVIEHVGLGRYDDALDPQGSAKAAQELCRVLAPGGRLLLSTPVGRERVQFNAHRIFAPETVVHLFSGLDLVDFAVVDDVGNYLDKADMTQAACFEYACGMFEFIKER